MRMSEHEIEFIVEKTTNKLDQQLTTGQLSSADYKLEMARLDSWAENQYRAVA